MKKYQQKVFFYLAMISLLSTGVDATAQNPIPVGRGSYAEYTPLSKSLSSEHSGDKSRVMETKELFVREGNGEPIPTNDWWTDLLNTRYSGNLWAYPQVVNAEDYGIYIAYPKQWTDDGCEMKWDTQLEVMGSKFFPESAIAERWHDWGLEMKMAQGEKEMLVTLAHGIPFTWIETKNLVPQLRVKKANFYNASGEEVILPVTTDKLVIQLGADAYGIYVPEETRFELNKDGEIVTVGFNGSKQFMSVAVLPAKEELDAFASYAYVVPRSTDIAWNYDEKTGKVRTNFKVTTENLNGGPEHDVLQGFIPHHYKRSALDFNFTDYTYATPRGKMQMAAGRNFSVTYDFKGILPYYAAPKEMSDLKNPYNRERMVQLISEYATKGSFGGDTYWGGKGLTQMALYMTFAYEMGEMELFEKCRDRLKDVMVNWLTYTPGENDFFFARYNRWGALVGYNTSYDSDTFNDHHFHYGYYTYAGALLALLDKDFCRDYGDMLTLIAKDYANWDKSDKKFPFFRTLDPWAGHSYAGGLGGWNGNGQESTSEAMQGWGGMYLLGVATGNKEMRDAGIFGWTTESRGVAEYWFDRDNENINREKYTKPYNSNLTSQGIGWWTWFSGDPVWMHSIQWMPISPCLKYLSENLEFARHDYAQMWAGKEIGGWDNKTAQGSLGEESGLGNVVLSYLQRFDPDSAAVVFDRMWNQGKATAKNPDTGGISYYILHSHRTYGEIDWSLHADIPTATAYRDKNGAYTYMVYNPEDTERFVKFYEGSTEKVAFKAPANRLTVYSDAPVATSVEIVRPLTPVVAPNTSIQLKARIFDQYGAEMDGTLSWFVDNGNGTVTNSGLFTAGSAKGVICMVTAKLNETVFATIELDINDPSVLTNAEIQPKQPYLKVGNRQNFSLATKDQYGNVYPVKVDWKIIKDGKTVKTDSILDVEAVGIYTVTAVAEGRTYTQDVYLTPGFPNLALNKVYDCSTENGINTAEKAFDGNRKDTRWESVHKTSNEWIYVDLGEKSYVSYVTFVWEPAYASLYEVQISDDGELWTTVKRVNGMGGMENIDLNCETRFVKMNGLERATDYGFSIYEFEVYGVPASVNENEIFGIQLSAPTQLLKEGESVQVTAKAYNGLGKEVPSDFTWNVASGKGTVINGLFTPQQYGNVTVEAVSNDKRAEKVFVVEESIKLSSIQINPHSAVLISGDSQDFEITTLDQFGCDIASGMIPYQIIGDESATFVNGCFTAAVPGDYKLVVGEGIAKDTADIAVADITEVNLAFNKPARASGSEGENVPANANDGDMKTRWGSNFEDGAYLLIDLEGDYVIDRVKLFWEDSHATSYRIDVSLDGDDWQTVYEKTGGKGGNEEIAFTGTAARYVRIVCLKRSSNYGSSLWEMEIYGNAKWQSPVPVDIRVTPQPLVFYCDEPVQLKATILDQYGIVVKPEQPVIYAVDGGGTITNDLFMANTPGEYKLTVSYGSLQKQFDIKVYAKKVLSRLMVTPDYYKLKVNEELKFEAEGSDQYNNPYAVTPVWSCTNGGTISPDGVFNATRTGTYTVMAEASGLTATSTVEVIEIAKNNLLLNKPATTSYGDGRAAVDGNGGTRWIAKDQSDLEWITIDMQGAYLITDIEIDWERAAAADYEVQISPDGEQWNTLQKVTGLEDFNANHTDQFRVSGVGRYIRVYCTLRNTVWAYSIIEMRAYGMAMKTDEPYLINLVNPSCIVNLNEQVTYAAEVRDINNNLVTGYPLNWAVSGGGTINEDGTYEAVTEGRYTLSVSCKLAQATHCVTVQNPVGMDNALQPLKVMCESGRLVISGSGIASVSLFDMQGNLIVAEAFCTGDSCTVETGNRKGIYLLMVRKHTSCETVKVIL